MTVDSQLFESEIGHVEMLVQKIERTSDESAREMTREIVRALRKLHGIGLRKILGIVSSYDGDVAVLKAFLDDDLVRSLLLLHDLHPETLEKRVRQALNRVRPYLQSHGGDVELLDVSPAGVRLRMEGSCHGCPSSEATLRDAIERAILEAAPDVAAIEVENSGGESPPAGLVSVQLPQNGNAAHANGKPSNRPRLLAQEN